MKKIFAIALALMLVMSMGTSAFAAEYVGEAALDATDSSISFNINGKIVDSTKDVSVIAVDVSYGAMRFVFAKESTSDLWNPANHSYDDGDENTPNVIGGGWFAENNSNFVTVTNHSNVKVGVKLDASTDIMFDPDGDSTEGAGNLKIDITNTTANSSEVTAVYQNTSPYATYSTAWHEVASAEGTTVDKAPVVEYLIDLSGTSNENTFDNFDSTEFTPIGTVTVSIKEADQTV